MKDIKLAIFDFDGTLADTQRTIVVAKQETMRLLGLEIKDEVACTATIGLSAKKGFQKTYPDQPEEVIDQCVAVYRRLFEELKETIPPTVFPGVEETLKWLKKQGIICTVATSRNGASLRYFLDKLQLASYFSYLLAGEDTKNLKPEPDPVLKTLVDLHIPVEQAIVIGDMPVDIRMGKSAGVKTVGVTYGNASREQLIESGADFVIDEMAALIPLLGDAEN